jgi:hypothetical protein
MSTARQRLAVAGETRFPPTMAERAPIGWRSLLVTGALVATAFALIAGLFTALGTDDAERLGFDFRASYYPAAEAVVDGRSPYPASPSDASLDSRRLYAYPPQLAVLVSPLTALPVEIASVLAVLLSLACLLGALALVGVRDVRCYAALVIWAPAWNALEMANVSALLALLLALVWRYRETLWPLVLAMGALVSLKLFLWPVLVWAAVSGRLRGAALAAGVGAVLTATSWALIGFAGFERYPELLDRIAAQESYSIRGIALAAGLGEPVAYVATSACVASLLVLCALYARRGDDERAFSVAVGAALAVSPVAWLHYLVLLAVPLGIARPRFSVLWLVPIVLWVCPRSGNGDGWETLLPAAAAAVLLGSLILRPREPAPAVAT